MNKRPILTASGDVIYGKTPEDGIIAKVYGDPELARLFAVAPEMFDALETFFKWFDKSGSSITQRWDRVPPEDRAMIVNTMRATFAKARGQ